MAGKRRRKLFEAIYRGDGRRIRKLLERGVSPHARDEKGSTALYVAAVQGEAWPVGELLAAGASPNVESRGAADGTPLCGAASWGHTAVLRALLAAGADPGMPESDGFTALAWAIRGGSYDAVALLIDAGADPNQSDSQGRTPLLLAAEQGRLALVRLLLEHGADASIADTDGRTARDAALAGAAKDIEPELRADAVQHAPAGSIVETRHTICVHVTYPDGGSHSSVELECSHQQIAALLAGPAEASARPLPRRGRPRPSGASPRV
jgi:ankyrin repeat protein